MTYKMGLGGLWLIGDFEGDRRNSRLQGKFLDTPASAKFFLGFAGSPWLFFA